MSQGSAPRWLRPVHRWFFWWEALAPSAHRVLAVVSAAGITTVGLHLLGLRRRFGGPVALAGGIGLAIAQEHDQRVVLAVDAEFEQHLRHLVDPLLARRGLVFIDAFGPRRARPDRIEAFLYGRPFSERASLPEERCVDLWIRRDRALGRMGVDLGGRSLAHGLSTVGEVALAERIAQVGTPRADAASIRSAVAAAPEDFWS